MKIIIDLLEKLKLNVVLQAQEIDKEFTWTQLFNPEFYINLELGGVPIGIYMVLFIVFAETGLFIGFFLPVIVCCFYQGFIVKH